MPTVQLIFRLRHPELVEWPPEPRFSARVQRNLLTASARIQASTPADDQRLQVETALLRLRCQPMSARQEMLLYYLLAQSARARDLSRSVYFGQALGWLTRADEIARALLDYGAQVDIHELRGTLHRAVSLYWIAAEEFSYALRKLREHAEDTTSFDPEFEVTLAAKAAMLDYMLANFQRALEHLRRADALLPLATASASAEGNIAWAFALLRRQRNEPVEALRHVEEAVTFYRLLVVTNSTCRVMSLAADIAMDAAESSARAGPAAQETYLALAGRYVDETIIVGREVDDQAGLELGNLARARLDRLRDPEGATGVEERIRATLRQAHRMRDDSLLSAAQTALGVELLTRGETTTGKRWLKKAIATARRIWAPGLAFRAERYLRRAEGRNA
jgi:hypothetical protein